MVGATAFELQLPLSRQSPAAMKVPFNQTEPIQTVSAEEWSSQECPRDSSFGWMDVHVHGGEPLSQSLPARVSGVPDYEKESNRC